jgi:hypothetical protein
MGNGCAGPRADSSDKRAATQITKNFLFDILFSALWSVFCLQISDVAGFRGKNSGISDLQAIFLGWNNEAISEVVNSSQSAF